MVKSQEGRIGRRWSFSPAIKALAGALIVVATVGVFSDTVPAESSAGSWMSEGPPARQVTITLNKSRTFRIDQSFASAVVGAPDIADARPMSDHVLYVQGNKIGTTNLVVFDKDMKVIGVMDITVTLDTGSLQQRIWGAGSRGVRVSSGGGQVILTGVAASAIDADRASSVAKGAVPQGTNVVNAIAVAPSQQVMLKVRFLEATRQAGRELGVNWYVGNGSGTRGLNTGLGTITRAGPSPVASGVPIFQAAQSLLSGSQPFGVALASLVNNGTSVDLMLSALEQKGLVRRLAGIRQPSSLAASFRSQ
jgi:pilus assembly protein CpaC